MCYNTLMDPVSIFVHFVLFFTIFAVMGYVVEAVNSLLHQGKLSNRGFLFGPYLPIYGFAGVIMIGLVNIIPRDNFVVVFLTGMLMGTTLEYITSYLLEKIFHLRWWDYSKTDKLNLNGRICLRNSLAFGVAGLFFVYLLMPGVNNLIEAMPKVLQIAIAIVMTIIYLVDFVASSYANLKVKNMEELSKAVGDQTKEIKKNAKKVIKTLLGNKRSSRKKRKKS